MVSTSDLGRLKAGDRNLRGADLSGANLSGANLSGANLSGADLRNANLRRADLRNADLRNANLRRADLRNADLRNANLSDASLSDANLHRADLRGAALLNAALLRAELSGADLCGADLRGRSVCPPTGSFTAFKMLHGGAVAELFIPAEADRVSVLGGRKCRASRAKVVSISGGATTGRSYHYPEFVYEVGKYVSPSEPFNTDIRLECASGIHFFMERQEAELYHG